MLCSTATCGNRAKVTHFANVSDGDRSVRQRVPWHGRRAWNECGRFGALMKHVIPKLALLLLCGATNAQDRHEYQFANVAGNRIAYSCTGEGDFTMVLVSGMGMTAHQSFGNSFHRFKGPGRLCLYDR